MIFFTNTMTQKKEPFVCPDRQMVRMYVCGITPYDYPHIGHGRCYVTFDLVYRMLNFAEYKVIYARNFTDIDDKLLKKSQAELGDPSRFLEISHRYIAAFGRDMQKLNCKRPEYEPRVTEVIPQIIKFIQKLIDKNFSYVVNGSVYYRVSKFKSYGALSKQSIKDLEIGARVEIDQDKENPLDFALWKKDEIVGYQSPWGKGRPGWHIECSVMVDDIFKGPIDIHGGGMDLMFPHHENEIAQSEGLYDCKFVSYWLHNAFVRINKEKMSKSLGNFLTLHEILEKYDPMVVRFYYLKHHYRNPLDFSYDDLKSAAVAYNRIAHFFEDVSEESVHDVTLVKKNMVVESMAQALFDDLNTSAVFGILFEKMDVLKGDSRAKALVKYFIVHVLGLKLDPVVEKSVTITPEIEKLLALREQARAEKNWKLSDEIRDKLRDLGFMVQDKKLNK
ncbi:cysteine--tRNA ligase [Candidatus Dependentiae bacterium]|nr:cysteine--tRNA ligase [Candidatus Dependentiae bacterium]